MNKHLLALAAGLLLMAPVLAQVSVTAPWVRATVPAQKSTGAFMHVQSVANARLVGVSSPVAGQAELHQMEMNGDMMKMRQVDSIALPAGRGVNLASGGYHIMLVDLKKQLKEGDTVPLTLVVESGKQRTSMSVLVPVKPIGFSGPDQRAAPMHH